MIYVYLGLQAVLFLMALFGYFQVTRFLGTNQAIDNPRSLAAFKRLVRVNMYASLVYLALGIPGILFSAYLAWTYGLLGMGLVIFATAPHFLFGQFLRKLEEKAKQLHCDPALDGEYRLIGETWHKKALPNF